jgi:putative tryptophan/tyrosine transport system substrate-binding protein
MNTRTFITAAAAVALLGTWAYRNQTATHKTKIAVITLVSHPILDAVQSGCLAELASQGFTDKNTEFIFANANGQTNDTSTIARSTNAREPDVVIAISTPMAQAMIASKPKCPVVFGAVTDPYGAGLVKRDSPQTNGSVSGSSDAVPY